MKNSDPGILMDEATLTPIYYHFYPAEPLWPDVAAEVMLVLINLCMLAYLKDINIKRAVDNVLSSHMARTLSELADKGDTRKQALIEPG